MIGNSAYGDGGGVYCLGAVDLTIRSSHFENNSAWGHGGAVGFDSPGNAFRVDGSVFLRNSAGAGGGGVSIRGAVAAAHIGTSVLSGNEALSGNGGGLQIMDTSSSSLCIAFTTQEVTGVRGANSTRFALQPLPRSCNGSLRSSCRVIHAGTLSVTAGGGMPSERDYVCAWHITPESVLRHSDCVVEVRIP